MREADTRIRGKNDMSSKWRDRTLREVYPYWILGEVPAEDLPFIAGNDMLAGNICMVLRR